MTQSKQTSSQMAAGPGMSQLTAQGPQRVEDQYRSDIANPNRLVPQAQGHTSRVLSGEFLNPASNPHLGALTDFIRSAVFPAVSSVFSRAGRGTSASASGLGGALSSGFTSALAPHLFGQYGQERGFQEAAAGRAPALDATSGLPLEQYLERMRSLATLGQKGTQTATPSPLQTIAGLGLTAASMFGSGPQGMGFKLPFMQ